MVGQWPLKPLIGVRIPVPQPAACHLVCITYDRIEGMKKKKVNKEFLFLFTIPILIRSLSQLLRIIVKAEKFTKRKKISNKSVFEKRLYRDMYHFGQQVQYAYFLALDIAFNLSNQTHPVFKYDEKTTTDLKRNLNRVIVYLKSLKPSHFRGAEKKRVPVFYNKKHKLRAIYYLQTLGLPDFFFHYTTAYGILRHLGVPIGKADFLGKF